MYNISNIYALELSSFDFILCNSKSMFKLFLRAHITYYMRHSINVSNEHYTLSMFNSTSCEKVQRKT